jgi:hypothetical protein
MTLPGTPTTWLAIDATAEGPDELVPAVLDALAAGRTAISAGYNAPVVLHNDNELVVIDAPNTLLLTPDGTRHPIRTAYETIPAPTTTGTALITHDNRFLSLTN